MTWNPSPPQKRCKVTIKREQYKIKCVLFLLLRCITNAYINLRRITYPPERSCFAEQKLNSYQPNQVDLVSKST